MGDFGGQVPEQMQERARIGFLSRSPPPGPLLRAFSYLLFTITRPPRRKQHSICDGSVRKMGRLAP